MIAQLRVLFFAFRIPRRRDVCKMIVHRSQMRGEHLKRIPFHLPISHSMLMSVCIMAYLYLCALRTAAAECSSWVQLSGARLLGFCHESGGAISILHACCTC